MSAPLERFTRLVIRFPVATLVLAGVAAAASLWLATTQLGFRTSRAELLSPNSEYNRRWLVYTKEFGDKEDVVVVVEGESREQIVPALDDACRELAARKDLFAAVLHQTDAPKLRSKGLYYLEMESRDPRELDLAKIDVLLNKAGPILQGDWSALSLGNMTHWMGSAINGGSQAQRQQILNTMQTELPRAIEGFKAAIGRAGPERSSAVATGSVGPRAADLASSGDCGLGSSSMFPWPEMPLSKSLVAQSAATRLISDDGRTGFILLRFLEEDKQSFAQNDESIRVLRQLTADVRSRHPRTKIGLTGLPIIEHDEMQSSEKSMSAATFLSFAGVLAVIIVAFGGFRHGVMAMTALVVGMIWACGCVALTVGHVNVLSIAFGSILFGLGIDYGIYYVARYLQLRRDTESTSDALAATVASTGPGVLTGALTSAIAFFAAGFTEFPGVAQLGLIAGGGVLLCWLAQTTVLPAMIRLVDADGVMRNLPEPLNLRFWLRPLFAYPRLTLLAAVACTAATAVGVHYLWYDYNLLNLQPAGLESVELEHKLFKQTNHSAWFALSIAATPEEVLAKRREFLKLASVERVEDAVSKLPCDCERKQPIIERIHQKLANLPQEVPQIPVTPLADLDRMLAGAQTMFLSMPEAAQATDGLRQLREMLRSIPPEEYERRIREYQQGMAADLLARLRTLQAASTPELPRVSDLPESVVSRFVGKLGPLPDAGLQQGEHLGSRPDGPIRQGRAIGRSRGHRQSAASLRGVVADETQLRAGRLLRLADDRAGGAVRFPQAQSHLAGGAADGSGVAANAGPDGAARHPAESGQHDRPAADARHRHGERHQPAARAALPARTLPRPRQRGDGRRGRQFAHHDGRLRRADDRQSSRAAKSRPRADNLDGLLPAQLAAPAESARARAIQERRR